MTEAYLKLCPIDRAWHRDSEELTARGCCPSALRAFVVQDEAIANILSLFSISLGTDPVLMKPIITAVGLCLIIRIIIGARQEPSQHNLFNVPTDDHIQSSSSLCFRLLLGV
jgi:hypothetical protein